MKDKISFLKNKIDLISPNKNIVPISTTIDSSEKLNIGGCSIEDLVSDMVNHDKELAKKDNLLKNQGYELSFPRE